MKKWTTLLALLTILTLGPARAETAPPPEASETPIEVSAGHLTLQWDDESIVLDFDTDPTYSYIENGAVQSSFFAYGADELLYEAYLFFPEDVASGEILSTETALQSGDDLTGILFYISDDQNTLCAGAAQYAGSADPIGSDYMLQFSEVSRTADSLAVSGILQATLGMIDESGMPLGGYITVSGEFQLTLSADATAAPTLPEFALPTLPPAVNPLPKTLPGLVTPPDAKKI